MLYIPVRQYLWATTLRCLQLLGNYWARHLPPSVTEAFYAKVDATINATFLLATDVGISAANSDTLHRIQLPIYHHGLGLWSLCDCRHAEYLCDLVQGIPPLMN